MFPFPRLSPTRAATVALARSCARLLPLAGAAALAACGAGAATAPNASRASQGKPARAPDFVYVSDASGTPQLWRWSAGTSTRLTFSGSTDTDPQSAAGHIVFTSWRDGDAEIYIATLDLAKVARLTYSAGVDEEPALDPSGARVVFVSQRGGTPRLWLMDSTGANQTALATGSAGYVPERAPAWSPDGATIAFTSTRTGTSQLWTVPAAGGAAVQVTHESGGAFDPAWSADGREIFYVSGNGTPTLRVVDLATGVASDYGRTDARSPTAVGQPACGAGVCLAVHGAYGTTGDIVVYSSDRSKGAPLVATAANETSPAILVP